MVATKRVSRSDNDSNDDVQSTTKLKQFKTTPIQSPTVSNMKWTKIEELIILGGILDYENEKGLSYRDDWDAFYSYVKGSEEKFSKRQVMDKVRNLKRRFEENLEKFQEDGKEVSFSDRDDDDIYCVSKIIWGRKERECVVDDGFVLNEDVPCVVEHEEVNNMDVEEEEKKEKSEDVGYVENEEIDDGEIGKSEDDMPSVENDDSEKKEKSEEEEEDGVDEVCLLQDALEEANTYFKSLSKYRKTVMFNNLKKLGGERRKELVDEWKVLVMEELKLRIKKQSFSAKLASAAFSC